MTSLNKEFVAEFQRRVLQWFDKHGRKHLPWQQNINAYRVWLSEIMLQQTQVKTVIPYFEAFTAAYPTVADLAKADIDHILHLWSGLGYYARARNMHRAANQVMEQFNGEFPIGVEALEQLSGVGRSTAGAIASIAQDEQAAILDGNVKRVLTRVFAIEGWPGLTSTQKALWRIAERLTPNTRCNDYTQVMMDLGATLCTRSKPNCEVCPLNDMCLAKAMGEPTRFPTSKPKKDKPVKTALILIYRNAMGELLLEQRPPTGIWGGLWCFPQEDIASLEHADTRNGEVLEPFRHTFSHYHFDMLPVVFDIETHQMANLINDRNTLWYNPDSPVEVGLAKPVSYLIKQITQLAPIR